MFSKDSKVADILKQYPWIKDEIVKMDPKFQILNTPVGTALIKNATVNDIAGKVGQSPEKLLAELQKMIDSH